MSNQLLCLLLALGAASACSRAAEPSAESKPLAVLFESNPWADVIGADTPRVAVYQDGLVVLWSVKKSDYVSKRLSSDELATLKAKLRSLGDVKVLKKEYTIFGPTDQPTTMLFLDLDGTPRGTSVYDLGDVSKADLDDKTNGPGLRLIKATRDLLADLSYPDARPWTPPSVEAMLWPFEYAEGESVPWPKDWPGLGSSSARKRHGDSYSIFLPPSKLDELHRLSNQLRKKNVALILDGKKWALAYRPAFPGEPVLRGAF